MHLQGYLDERLWRSIQSSYENRNFTGAILDAIYFLSDLIREKTDLESDGTALIGQAFGGKTPKLRVNKLQTDSEKNIQAGVEQLLRGLFRSIRNPRSHEKYVDNQRDADAIIVFVNYLLGIIDQSKTQFTKAEFLSRVFDPNFVKKDRYAELLVDEIPPRHRLEVMLDVLQEKGTGDGENLRFFVSALFSKLKAQDKRELFRIVSEELKTTTSDKTIRYILQIFPPDTFLQYDETARMRIENKLIESISEGLYDRESKTCAAGALGTWAQKQCKYFLLKKELANALIDKISSSHLEEHDYLIYFFWDILTELVNPPSKRLVYLLNKKIKSGNRQFYNQVTFEKQFGNGKWVKPFEEAIATFKKSEPTSPQDNDNIPF